MRITEKSVVEIPRSSSLYPKEWAEINDAPETLYAVGNIRLLQERKLTIVGSRRTPVSALKLGAEIARSLSSALVLLTGSADGGDTAVIEGGLEKGNIVCLLAGGFAHLPQASLSLLERVAEKGLLLSPHPYDTPVRTFSFEYRNKLLAALGEGTFVLGAPKKSGALITAKYAEKLGKKLFAIPYAPNTSAGEGCNALIKKGAYLTENAGDILSALGIEERNETPKIALKPDEEKLLQVLKDKAEAHASELSQATGIPVFKLRAILSALEVKGLVVALGGNRYSPV